MRNSFDNYETNLPQNIKYNKLTNWQHLKLFAKRKIGTFKKITQSLPNPFVHTVQPPSLGTTPSSSHSPTKSFNHNSKTPPTVFITPPPTPRASPTVLLTPPSTPRNYPTKSLPTPKKYPTKSFNHKSPTTPRASPTKSFNHKSPTTPRASPTKSFNHKSLPTHRNYPTKSTPTHKKYPTKSLPTPRKYPTKSFNHKYPPRNYPTNISIINSKK